MDKRGGQKSERPLYKIYCYAEIALGVVAVVFALIKLGTGLSICHHMANSIPLFQWISNSKFINSEAITAVAETVGFGSILIVWIYSALDKEEMNVCYGDLLRAIYPQYHYFVLGHLAAMIFCLWMAHIEYIEAACWALAVILCGCVIQWKALSNIIFSNKKRREIALAEWNRRAIEDGANTRNPREVLSCIYGLEQVLPFNDGESFKEICWALSLALQRYAATFRDQCGTRDQQKWMLREMVDIWECLLEKRSADQQDMLLKNLFCAAADRTDQEERKKVGNRVLCASYICWLYENGRKKQQPEGEVLSRVSEKADYLASCTEKANGSRGFPTYFNNSVCFLYGIAFFSGKLESVNILNFQDASLRPWLDNGIMSALTLLLFGEDGYQQYYELVWNLLSEDPNEETQEMREERPA